MQRANQEKEAQRQREEQVRLVEQQRREEEIRRKKDEALTTVAMDLFHDPEEGLLRQFLENQLEHLFREIAPKVRWEKLTQHANERYHAIQQQRARWCFAHWVAMTAKKRRTKHARERRKRLRESAEVLGALKNDVSTNGTLAVKNQLETTSTRDQPKAASTVANQPKGKAIARKQPVDTPGNFKRPVAPASSSTKVQKPQKQKKKSYEVRPVPAVNGNVDSMKSSQINNMIPYKNSKAPIDRTETDWFRLRAAGIDPSKHRKRSFGSASDDEEDHEADRKRRRQSTSSASRTSLPPAMTDEERLARFRAVKEALGKSTSASRLDSSTRPINGHTSVIIAQARDILSTTPTPNASSPNVQHEFSRSVPDLNSYGSSRFGKGADTSTAKDYPAYRDRLSRFVPRHLYGLGKDALIEYREQQRRSASEASMGPRESLGPLELSSPIPTQQSFTPIQRQHSFPFGQSPTGMQSCPDQHSSFESQQSYASGQSVGDYDSETGYDNNYPYSGTGEDSEMEDMDEEGSTGIYGAYAQMEDYDCDEQNAQMAGATQDDAIELSD